MKGTPNNLGSSADALYELRAERLKLEKQVQELKAKEKHMSEALIEECINQGLTGARGHLATISLNPATVPSVVNWEQVENYIYETKRFHLMQRRVSSAAYLEILQMGEQVPGIEPTTLTKLSLSRVTK